VPEVACRLGVNGAEVYGLILDGELPAVKGDDGLRHGGGAGRVPAPTRADAAVGYAARNGSRFSVTKVCDHGRNVGPCHTETAGHRRALTCDFFIKRELGGEDSNPQ
jgi:hypothetical protein